MSLTTGSVHDFDRQAFTRANVEMTTLKARLPEAAVISLAREVVSRLASRVTEVDARRMPLPDAAEIDALCAALVSDDLEAGAVFITDARRNGASVETIYLTYLASAAQRLGDWWEADRISFVAVTIAASRIYAIMRGLRDVIAPLSTPTSRGAVFASVPDETHTLGVTMAADLFRKNGWDIVLRVGYSHDQLVNYFRTSGCHVIGLSASGSATVLSLARLMVALRISNPGALIMISGHVVVEEAATVAQLGADAVVNTVPDALDAMDRLMAQAMSGRRAYG